MPEKAWRVPSEHSFREMSSQLKGHTVSAIATAFFLAVREMEGDGPATITQIEEETGISRRTLERALPALRRAGLIVEAKPTA